MEQNASVVYTILVDGMHSASCGMLIDETLDDIDGVLSSATNHRSGKTTVEVDPARCRPDDVVEAITAAGYLARVEQR